MKTPMLAIIVTILLSVGVPSFAHHSHSMFEPDKEVTLTGTVKEFQYTSPHTWLIVNVANADGTVTTWGFEGNTPSVMGRAGIHKNSLPFGTKVTVTGSPLRDGRPAARWNKVVLADGTVFDWRAAAGR